MKNFFAGLFVAFLIAPAFSFDTWYETKYESGESMFSTQSMPSLMIGHVGVGLSYQQFFSGRAIIAEKTLMHIDGKQYPVEISTGFPGDVAGLSSLLIKNGKDLIPMIASAKKIELETRQCGGACGMTKTGGTYKTLTWEFETTLAEQFKNYQEKIR